ncbi:MAG: PEGA domain-containing protein [Ignavibacteriaceae bacterium]|nr:PEGA domain-containing protein [Ignavibacteriaceae bacterium]HRN25008.1 PEGA domain-containing protein [Ignavibacteriaceae bacterium]HRQ52612.1 PEGA domain-containing protein [Ignavibacteriaceae bacterium]
MKNLFLMVLVTIAALAMVSCDSTTDPVTPTPDPKGNLFVSSVPAGAQIWINGSNTNKFTPDTVKDIITGVKTVTLKLQDYSDTTFSVSVSENQTAVVSNVQLVSNIFLDSFGPVKIWETTGTSASQPSGLDLSTGMAYGISSADKDKVDIYYYSNSAGTIFIVQSAAESSGLTRVTKFRVGSSTSLNDGTDSPLNTAGTWTTNMNDRETNYVFLYDNDGNYSKAKISGFGGGTPGNPAWVELTWLYNKTANDNRF